jgi:phytanoyl-CoA hydroxylase
MAALGTREMLRRLYNAIDGRDASVRFAPMWIDRRWAAARLPLLPAKVRRALRDLRELGIAVLPSNISASACDGVVGCFTDFCTKTPDHVQFQDESGHHDRLCNLQLLYPQVRELALNPTVLAIIEAAFEAKADVVGSLFFERGSEQDIHRDSPAFYTNPLNRYFGVWHALEDVHEDAGALSYYPGGHRVAPDAMFVGTKMGDYFEAVEQACISAKIKRTYFHGHKGDTVIWHPQLPHGGSPITDRKRSRRSIVFHYKPFKIPIYGADTFFGDQSDVSQVDPHPYVEYAGHRFLDHGQVLFMHNRKEGNFDGK